MPSSKARTSNSPPRPARSYFTTRISCWRMATAGNPNSPVVWNWTRPIDDRHIRLLCLFGDPARLGRDGGELTQSGALGAVPDPVVLQRRGAVPDRGRRIPGDD